MWIWGLSLWSKNTKIVWQKVLIIFQMFEHLPLHGIRLQSVSLQTAIRMKWMPCNFHTVGLLKKSPQRPMFLSDDVWTVVVQWFRQQPKEFFVHGIHQVVHQWDSCLNACSIFFFFNCCSIFTRRNLKWVSAVHASQSFSATTSKPCVQSCINKRQKWFFMVHGYVRLEADNGVPLHDAANCNKQMVVGYCVCLRTIQNIANQPTPCTRLLFENHLIFSHWDSNSSSVNQEIPWI